MDSTTEDETSYTTQSPEAFLKYVENTYCTEHTRLPVTKPKKVLNNNPVSSTMASRSGQSTYDSTVRHGSNPLERLGVGVAAGTEPLQQVLPRDNPDCCNWAGFTTKYAAF